MAAIMDSELRESFTSVLETARGKGQRLTTHATTLLTVMMESIADDPDGKSLLNTRLRVVQKKAVNRIPAFLKAVHTKYHTEPISGLMLLSFMPSLMEKFCPPFEKPPNY